MSGQDENTSARDAHETPRADGRSNARVTLREAIVAFQRVSSDEDVLMANNIVLRPEAYRATHTALLKAARDFARELRQAHAKPERGVMEVTAVVAEVDPGEGGVHRRVLDAVVREAVEAYYGP